MTFLPLVQLVDIIGNVSVAADLTVGDFVQLVLKDAFHVLHKLADVKIKYMVIQHRYTVGNKSRYNARTGRTTISCIQLRECSEYFCMRMAAVSGFVCVNSKHDSCAVPAAAATILVYEAPEADVVLGKP